MLQKKSGCCMQWVLKREVTKSNHSKPAWVFEFSVLETMSGCYVTISRGRRAFKYTQKRQTISQNTNNLEIVWALHRNKFHCKIYPGFWVEKSCVATLIRESARGRTLCTCIVSSAIQIIRFEVEGGPDADHIVIVHLLRNLNDLK